MFFEEKKKNLFKLWTRLLTVHNSTCNAVMKKEKKLVKRNCCPFFLTRPKTKCVFLSIPFPQSICSVCFLYLFYVSLLSEKAPRNSSGREPKEPLNKQEVRKAKQMKFPSLSWSLWWFVFSRWPCLQFI